MKEYMHRPERQSRTLDRHTRASKPTQLQTLDYTQRTDIHESCGQEKQLPHRERHVVQQNQGHAQPAMQLQGGHVNDNKKEAGTIGEKFIDNTPNTHSNRNNNPTKIYQFRRDDNIQILPENKVYYSQPHGGIIYKMIVDLGNDEKLLRHIDKAQATVVGVKDSSVRVAMLMKYTQSLTCENLENRDKVYKPTSEKKDGCSIKQASLGECLDTYCACREIAAFAQILLSQEHIATTYRTGYVQTGRPGTRFYGGTSGDRHAWLEINAHFILDPTWGQNSLGTAYTPDKNSHGNFTEPIDRESIDFDKVHGSLADTSNWEKTWWGLGGKKLQKITERNLKIYNTIYSFLKNHRDVYDITNIERLMRMPSPKLNNLITEMKKYKGGDTSRVEELLPLL